MRIVFTLGLLVGLGVTAGFVSSTLRDMRGFDVLGEIVKVEHHGTKTLLTVRFTASDGRRCESHFRSFTDRSALGVGDQIQIHHPSGSPCINVREASEPDSWMPVVVMALLTIGFASGAYVAWFPPTIPPSRYSGLP
ncbi:hypothetical protein [Plantactinospora sp. KLBMP9567]|uniref:hypothetical protein n=1 Tax=Plantactinospora sp. KLBMP9567 TaxID=3085900 RepID=UPI002981551D|nr:hypothetical protein [Plantactinospora sp. KLBMP9567]MDW5328383.1 hypothetical protein [Plantactinospora sp. KLBMP9567]